MVPLCIISCYSIIPYGTVVTVLESKWPDIVLRDPVGDIEDEGLVLRGRVLHQRH